MQIQINQPGILSTIQDMGRPGFRSQAVAVSGAMDTLSARVANIALGNDCNTAVIEFTYAAATFTTLTNVLIAYAGTGAFLQTNEQVIPVERPVFIPANQVVTLVPNLIGCRTYLAVAGGWDVPVILGSSSTFLTASFGGFYGRTLQKGDILSASLSVNALAITLYQSLQSTTLNYPNWSLAQQHFQSLNHKSIRVIKGNEVEWFDTETITDFYTNPFVLTQQSNRMGYQLQGCLLPKKTKQELLSTAVVPGTIQVTGSGNLILLMADCQTTGGYPRIAQVAAIDMPLCGQLKPGDTIFFKEISSQQAEILYFERERQLARISAAIATKYLK